MAIEQWRGRGEKEFPLCPFDLPFLLLSLQLSWNNSIIIGNVCYATYGFFNRPTMVHTQILGAQNKDFVSSFQTALKELCHEILPN